MRKINTEIILCDYTSIYYLKVRYSHFRTGFLGSGKFIVPTRKNSFKWVLATMNFIAFVSLTIENFVNGKRRLSWTLSFHQNGNAWGGAGDVISEANSGTIRLSNVVVPVFGGLIVEISLNKVNSKQHNQPAKQNICFWVMKMFGEEKFSFFSWQHVAFRHLGTKPV